MLITREVVADTFLFRVISEALDNLLTTDAVYSHSSKFHSGNAVVSQGSVLAPIIFFLHILFMSHYKMPHFFPCLKNVIVWYGVEEWYSIHCL